MQIIPLRDTVEFAIWLEPGTRFHRWTIVGTPVRARADLRPCKYLCQCECGKLQWIMIYDLIHEKTKGCHSCKSQGERNSNYRHGGCLTRHSKLYGVWSAMKRRCSNPNNKDWPNYGGRGIKVCEEWLDYRTFRAWASTHGYAEGLTLERRDNDQGYEPGNCCWIPQSEQSGNRRSRWRDKESGSLFEE